MAPSGRERRQRRQGRAVRTEGTGPARAAGSHAARRLRAPPAGSARLPGSPIPRRRRHPARGSARLRRDPKRSSGRRGQRGPVRAGPAGQEREPVKGGSGRCSGRRVESGGRAQPSRSEAPGREGRRAHSRDGPGALATEGARAARAAPPGVAPLPEPWTAGPAARSRRKRAPWDGPGCRGGRAAGPHSPCPAATAEAAAARRERSGRSERVGSHRSPPALVPERSVCERSEGDTRTRTPAHPGAPREEGGQPLSSPPPTLARPGARWEGGFLSASSPSRHSKLRVTKAQDTRSSTRRARPGAQKGAGSRTGVYPLSLAAGRRRTKPSLPLPGPALAAGPILPGPGLGLCATRAGAGVSARLCLSLVAALAAER